MDLDNRSREAANLWSVVCCLLSVRCRHRSPVYCLLFVVCCLCLLLASCAKVGDPLPPLVRHPETVTDMKVVQVGDHFQIVFPLPPGEIERVEIYRQCGINPSLTEEAEATVRLQRDQLSQYHEGNEFVFEDSPCLDQTCIYGLRFHQQPETVAPLFRTSYKRHLSLRHGRRPLSGIRCSRTRSW